MYYFIDYKMFVDVVKYKMYLMKKCIEDKIKNVLYFIRYIVSYHIYIGNGEQRL